MFSYLPASVSLTGRQKNVHLFAYICKLNWSKKKFSYLLASVSSTGREKNVQLFACIRKLNWSFYLDIYLDRK